MNLDQICDIAIKAALEAGAVIRNHAAIDIEVETKVAGSTYASQVVTEVDRKCESKVVARLLPTCTEWDIALLSEEGQDSGDRLIKNYFWCIDPMDGTYPFVQKRPGYSVSIALVARDGTPTIGVVYDPSRDNLYHAIIGKGAYKNNIPWQIDNQNNYLTYVTDRKLRDTPRFNEIQSQLDKLVQEYHLDGVKELSGAGSVLNAIRVLEHRPACMIKLPKKQQGGGSIWDFAATACMFTELGQIATDYRGQKLDLNPSMTTFMNQNGIFYSNLVKQD